MADLDELFADLHEELVKKLLKKVKDGTATAAEFSVARQFLKDNHITAVPAEGTPLGELEEKLGDLPEFDEDDNVVSLGGKVR